MEITGGLAVMQQLFEQANLVFDYVLKNKTNSDFKRAFGADAAKLFSHAEHGREMVKKEDTTRTRSALINVENVTARAPHSDFKETILNKIQEVA